MSNQQINGLVKGLHHITLVTSNQEINRRFYNEILGLRRVKYTVNQDDIFHRHLFYGDEKGTTGSAITFFEWPDLPHGPVGLGSPHHLSYTAPDLDAIPKWKSWLSKQGISTVGPFVRDGRVSLYLKDPDGVVIEIASPNKDNVGEGYFHDQDSNDIQEITQNMRLTTFNHASPVTSDPSLTSRFMEKLLGLESTPARPNPDQHDTQILEIGSEERPDFLRYLSSPDAPRGFVGKGNVHHIAMVVEEDEDQRKILKKLNDTGITNSGVIDRFWFHSLYFRDPDGNLLEIATKKPGYAADEAPDKLGTKLVLPQWLEPKRQTIEQALEETDSKNRTVWPPHYEKVSSKPESLVLPESPITAQ